MVVFKGLFFLKCIGNLSLRPHNSLVVAPVEVATLLSGILRALQ